MGKNTKNAGKKTSPADNSKKNQKMTSGRRTLLILIVSVILIAGVVSAVLLIRHGAASESSGATPDEPTAATPDEATAADGSKLDKKWTVGDSSVTLDQFKGSWVSYADGIRFVYEYDGDHHAHFSDSKGNESVYHYGIEGDRIVLSNENNRMVFLWSEEALTFMIDHQYGEAATILYDVSEVIEDFRGYMYRSGDYLYIGQMCMCSEDSLKGADDQPLLGSWTGAACDRVTFDDEGHYHYRDNGFDYDGEYRFEQDGEDLILSISGQSTVYEKDDWSIDGRILRLKKRYYFRDTE